MKKQRLTEWQGKALVLLALLCWGGFWIPFVFTSTGVTQMEQHITIFVIATCIVGGVVPIAMIVYAVRNRKHLNFRFWK